MERRNIVQRFWANTRWMVGLAAILFLPQALMGGETVPRVESIGVVRIPGTATDLSGQTGSLETNTPANALGGFSAIDYTGDGDEYLVLSDRGPADGAASFACRFHRIVLQLDKAALGDNSQIKFQLRSSHLFTNGIGNKLTGSLAALRAWDHTGPCPSLDPEGLRKYGTNILVSDEYGPSIQMFANNGKFVSSLPLPAKFALSEMRKPAKAEGAFANRGLEGLCVTPDESTVIGVMQGPLVQDGRIENNKCLGIHTRWIRISKSHSHSTELLYDLENESTGVSEILAIDNERFLVLERDSLMGENAKIKRIYLANTRGATDISQVDSLLQENAAPRKAIQKELLLDLLDSKFGLSGAAAPEKPEGLAWGPRLSDGRRLLVVCFDNDFNPANDSIIAAFAVSGLD